MDFVECFARAIMDHNRRLEDDLPPWNLAHPAYRRATFDLAVEALDAIAATGCKIVDMEPTDQMVQSGIESDDKQTGAERLRHMLRAILASAPAWPGADDNVCPTCKRRNDNEDAKYCSDAFHLNLLKGEK